jgi:carbonic anhydrase/acetyltransferase-like protein (isoleucine patch superfamily)
MLRARQISLLLPALALLAEGPLQAVKVDARAEVHPTAVLIGNVTVGPYTRIGPKAVVQGDVTIGHHVNILGQAVISADKLTIGDYVKIDYGSRVVAGRPQDTMYIRDNCWVGMNATVRGARMEEGSAVGMRAVAEFNTHLERGAVLAPGAVTTHGMVIPADSLAEGYPAEVTREGITDRDRQRIFGVVHASAIHQENDQIAKAIERNPPKARNSYPGIDGRPFWSGKVNVDPTAQVHPTAILMNTTIGAHSRVGPNVVIARAVIGHHCDIRANTNIRSDVVIGNYCLLGERTHVGSSRDGGFDNPLWIKDYTYVSPGSVVHATKIDEGVYYGANALTDYGGYLHRNALLTSGASLLHDTTIREEAVVRGSPGIMDKDPGIPDELRMKLLGFLPKRWLVEVNGPALEKRETYETPLKDWEHTNTGSVKGEVQPGAIVVGNVSLEEGARVYAGAYVEGNVHFGKGARALVGVMIISDKLEIGAHTHIYDQAMVVDGRAADTPQVGLFSWINHMASLQGTRMEDFALANIGAAASPGTRIGREALLLNGAATYADQALPPRSISYGIPVKVRVTESTMRERMLFFYGRDWPTWERQASAEDLKRYRLPQ